MMEQSFDLIPLPDPRVPDITITGCVARKRNRLTVHYALSGKLDDISLPAPAPRPERRQDLWLSTCFEFFLSIPGQPQYWEFNIAPSGEWNAFRMDAYRRVSFREDESIQAPQLKFERESDCYQLEITVDLSPILDVETQVQVGVSSVIQTLDGHETYWALMHPGSEADFHWRESFILALEG
jgi:hypothetical protein